MSQFYEQELFRIGVSRSDLGGITKEAKISSYSADEVICKSGEAVKSFCMIINGFVTANAPSQSGGLAIEVYGPKMWFGEVPIINKKKSHLEFKCVTDVELMSISAEAVQKLFRQSITFANFIGELIAWRLKRQSDTLVVMRLGSPHLRVVSGIALFAETLEYKGERPPTIGMGESYLIPLKQAILASLCGVSRTVFSECIQKISHQGLLEIHYGKIEVKQLEIWRRFIRSREGLAWEGLNSSIDEIILKLNG